MLPPTRTSRSGGWAVLWFPVLSLASIASAAHHLRASNGSALYIAPNPNPDVTGRVSVPGFDLNAVFPGRPASWELELNITQNGTGPRYWQTYAGNTTVITARLVPPAPGQPGALLDEDGVWAVDNAAAIGSWRLAVIGWSPENTQVVGEENDHEEGSCPDSAVDRECHDRMRQAVMERPEIAQNQSSLLEYLPRCSSMDILYSIHPNMNNTFMNKTTLTWDFANEYDFYNTYGAHTTPIMIVWGRNNTSIPLLENHVQFACIKADTVTREGLELPTGAGNRLDAGWQVVWYAAGLAVLTGFMLVG